MIVKKEEIVELNLNGKIFEIGMEFEDGIIFRIFESENGFEIVFVDGKFGMGSYFIDENGDEIE